MPLQLDIHPVLPSAIPDGILQETQLENGMLWHKLVQQRASLPEDTAEKDVALLQMLCPNVGVI